MPKIIFVFTILFLPLFCCYSFLLLLLRPSHLDNLSCCWSSPHPVLFRYRQARGQFGPTLPLKLKEFLSFLPVHFRRLSNIYPHTRTTRKRIYFLILITITLRFCRILDSLPCVFLLVPPEPVDCSWSCYKCRRCRWGRCRWGRCRWRCCWCCHCYRQRCRCGRCR